MADGDTFGSGLNFGVRGGATAPPDDSAGPAGAGSGADVTPSDAPPAAAPSGGGFGSSFGPPQYKPSDANASALDQSADLLQQRINRAQQISTNPIAQFFNPEGVQAARAFVPQATEQLQTIRQQKATIAANQQQAVTLGLAPGEVPDQATQEQRIEFAKNRALKGDMRVFQGLQAVDPKAAESIQDQVHEAVAGHLTNAQYAFDSLAGMTNQGQYQAKLNELRQKGTLGDLEALGLKVPPTFDAFNASKSLEGKALRDARVGVDTIRQKLEDRNTYQPMEEKEAKTYNGRLTTAYGDQITNGTWSHNGAAGTRGLVVNGAADPRDLGKNFTLATPEQRKAITEEFSAAVPKEDVEKYRAFNRTYHMATTDAKGNTLPDGKINTNPNVQQGIAEGLASMLRGGSGGANVGLLKIELAKRGWAQGAIDGLVSNYAGALNTMFSNANKPYLTEATQRQIRDVMDVLKTYTGTNIGDRASQIAQRAGALGLDSAALGLGKGEATGVIGDAMETGRQAQIARMMPGHQSIGGGDGVLQLGAQRPGSGATGQPPGTATTTQLPGAQPLQTPVQQATQPQPGPSQPPPTPSSTAPPQAPAGGGGGPAPAPITVAGQSVNVPLPPGASPGYVQATQRIESGNERDPWTAGTKGSSASGAFQFINSTWAANKPAGAPARAGDATPAQQAQAFATLTAKNAQSLTTAGLPVNDTTLYVAHNLGATGASRLLSADPNADARTVVGEAAARNNPAFFRGKPTVAIALQRYDAEMNKEPPRLPPTGDEPKGQTPGLLTRISRALSQGIPGGSAAQDAAVAGVGNAAVQNAPAIGSTLGAVGGSLAGPAGTIGGGAAGGGAGQALKDYLQGNAQSPTEIAKQTALGGVLGVGGAARPLVNAAARAAGAGAVEAGAKAAEGGDAADITEAGLKGVGAAAGGEAFGRALGMVGHKVFSMFAPNAQKAVQEAAAKYAAADEALKTEQPKLFAGNQAAAVDNPKYTAAEKAKTEAEQTLKDAGLKPEEAAYAHKVSSDVSPPKRSEAEVGKPGALEKERIGAGYQGLENEVGAAGKGAPKATPKLSDGPIAAVENKKVSADHAELAQRTEAAITAPAPDWQTKWNQLKDARSALLDAERDAMTSTAPGRTQTAKDMRTLADTVRVQQAKAANYVFGAKDGPAFMDRLKVLDVRYRNLMEATNGGDLAKAAAQTGEAGREADRKFRAFAHDDPTALAAWGAMRKGGPNVENDVLKTIQLEKVPVVGQAYGVVKYALGLRKWMQDRAAGNPAKFSDFIRTDEGRKALGQNVRDLVGTAVQRGVTMQ